MRKRLLSLFLSGCMMFSLFPVSAFAAQEAEPMYVDGEIEVSTEMATALVDALVGTDHGEAVQDGDGYKFELSPEASEALTQATAGADETASEKQNEDNANTDQTDYEDNSNEDLANVVPADYVDDSNEGLEELLEELAGMPEPLADDSAAAKKVDLFFVIDSTGSMYSSIRSVKENVAEFAQKIGASGVNLRLGLIDFRDITVDGDDSTTVHIPSLTPWLDVPTFITELTKVEATGGGDTPETPIDALGNLTTGTTGWNSDAYKFAVLITDADYKTNNNHGIADMDEMVDKLVSEGIQVSTITPKYVAGSYGDLAGYTGGVQFDLSHDFADDLMDYANEVIGSALAVTRDYTLRVLDDATGLPVAGAVVRWNGGSAISGADGIVKITTNKHPVENVTITYPGYRVKELGNLYEETLDVKIATMEIDEGTVEDAIDKGETVDTPALNESMFKNPTSASADANAMQIEFLGKKFNLLKGMEFGIDLNIFGGKLEISNNKAEKKYEVMIGYEWDKASSKDEDPYWKDDYKKYKSLVQNFSKKSAKEIYNEFRTMRTNAKKLTSAKGKLLFPVDFSVGGFAEVSYASGKIDGAEGGVVIGISTGDTTLFEYPLPPAPYIFFKLDFQMDAKGQFTFIKIDSTAKVAFTPKASFEVEPGLTGTLNLGVPKLASVGGGLNGTLDAKLDIPFKTLEDGLEVSLKASWLIKLDLLGFTAAKVESDIGKLQLFPLGKSREAYALASLAAEDFELIPRPEASGIMTFASDKYDFLKSGVYVDCAPQLIRMEDGTLLLVWIDAVKERTDANMAGLYYVVKPTGGEWSAPTLVNDDGTSDYMPSLTLNSAGNPVVVWQNVSKQWTSTPILVDVVRNIDLMAAAYNPETKSFEEPVMISEPSNDRYETAVQVTAENVYWMETTADHPLLDAGTAVIKKNALEGGRHSKVADANLANGLNGFAAGVIGSTEYIAYADMDRIYYNTDSEARSIATAGESSGLQIVSGRMYWSDEDGLRSWSGSGSDPEVESSELKPAEFTVLSENGNTLMLIPQNTGITNELYASQCIGGSWHTPVPVTDYGKSLSAVSAVLNDDNSILWACGLTDVDKTEFATESMLIVDSCKPAADVVVGETGYVPSLDVIPGKPVNVSIELANQGLGSANGLTAELTYQGIKTSASLSVLDEYGYSEYLTSLEPGEALWAEVPFTLPDSLLGGELMITVKDSSGTTCGTAKAAIPAAAADIVVENASTERTATGASVSATVTNAGYADAASVRVVLTMEGETDALASETIEALATGSSKPVVFNVPKNKLAVKSPYEYKSFTVTAEPVSGEAMTGNNSDTAVLAPVKATSVKIEGEDAIAMKGGETVKLSCIVAPAEAPVNLSWMSTDNAVVVVDEEGKITARGDGEADIIVSAADTEGAEGALRDSVHITVTEGLKTGVSSVSIAPEETKVAAGKKVTLKAVVLPESALNKKVSWHIDKPDVAELEDHEDGSITVTGVKEGDATVTVVTVDGSYTAKAVIHVGAAESPEVIDKPVRRRRHPSSSSTSSEESTDYRVSVSDGVKNGSISVSPTRAEKNDTVTVTVKPDSGYVLDSITAFDKNDNELSLRQKSENQYSFTMPDRDVRIEAEFAAVAEPDLSMPYTDISASDPNYEAVRYVYEKGIMTGTSNTAFSPNVVISRGMIVSILHRLEKEPTAAGKIFPDVAAGSWYENAVAWASANGIVSGYSDGRFGPDDTITKEQLLSILNRYAQYKGYNASGRADISAYQDADGVSSYALEAVQWAVSQSLMSDTQRLNAPSQITRVQAADILTRFCQNVAK